MSVLDQWQQIKKNIAATAIELGRDPASIQLLVVSKKQSPDSIAILAGAGQAHFGESYCQEAIQKIEALKSLRLVWHFIGPIQSNKVKWIAEYFDTVHSLDRLSIAAKLEQELFEKKKILNVFVQVNISQEPQKSGLACDQVISFVEKLRDYPHLNFQGLMGLGPWSQDLKKTEQAFSQLAELQKKLGENGLDCPHLSMGMSHDYVSAIAYGSTWLRLGSAIFEIQGSL